MAVQKRALLISYFFPPSAVSSGLHRIVSLANELVAQNWEVAVLSVNTRAYDRVDIESLSRIDPKVEIIRANAFDAKKHFAFRGKYFQFLALPDNLQSWIPFGVIRGLWEVIRNRPRFILSSYPIASAHLIAIILHKLTRVPWVADFRDPMAQPGYPSDRRKREIFKWIEQVAAKNARQLVFTTSGCLLEYQYRYPFVPPEKWLLVPNGFEEAQFDGLVPAKKGDGIIRLVHSGLIYLHERNPRKFFEAIALLKEEKFFDNKEVRFILRGSGHEKIYSQWIQELDLDKFIELAPHIPYREALQEMLDADALLLFQGPGCNQQIPAKAYEYIRAGKPVLALTDEAGDTAKLLRKASQPYIAALNNKEDIKNKLTKLVQILNSPLESNCARPSDVAKYSRENISKKWVASIGDVLL